MIKTYNEGMARKRESTGHPSERGYRPAGAITLLFAGVMAMGLAWICLPAAAQPAPGRSGAGTSDPRAIPNACALLEWLRALPSKRERRVLSGQDIGAADGPQGYNDYVLALRERTGKWPAMIGTDYWTGRDEAVFQDADRKTRLLAGYWEAGGLVTVYAHLGNPWTAGGAWDVSTASGSYADAYTPDTPAYAALALDFDRLAGEFRTLQSRGVAVLFRPFHEANGKWFWWHHRDPEQFKRLWRFWHGYLVREKGVHNLLFVFAPSAPPRLVESGQRWPWEHQPWEYYPGDAWVDINALDFYGEDPASMPLRAYERMIALGKPFGFAEMGGSLPPTPESPTWDQGRIIRAIRSRYPAAAFWYSWSSWEPDGIFAMAELPDAEGLLGDPWVANRGDVDFPRAGGGAPIATEGATRKLTAGFIDFTDGQSRSGPFPFEAGRRSVQEKLGGWLNAVPVRGVGTSTFRKAVDRLVRREGCTVIFTNAFGRYDSLIAAAARDYPDILFEAPQAAQAGRPANLKTYAIDDGGWQYLMGVIAGAITESGRIGFIGWAAENWQLIKANEFALGVRAVNPRARVHFRLAGGDGEEAVRILLAEGCDVFNDAADSVPNLRTIASMRAAGKRVYAFGENTPYEAFPEVLIASQPKDFGLAFERILADARASKTVPRDFRLGMRDGALRPRAGRESLNPEIADALRLKRVRSPDAGEESAFDFFLRRFDELQRGSYQPFTGPIVDQRGVLRLQEGRSDGSWEFKGGIDWLAENVVGDPRGP